MSRFRGGGSRGRGRPGGGARGGRPGSGSRPGGPGSYASRESNLALASKVVTLPPSISVVDLATTLNTPPAQIIKALLQKGISSTINNLLEHDASQAIAEALGFTVITALSLSSYVAMRARYCCTISRDVVRFCSSAVRRSARLVSTTDTGP